MTKEDLGILWSQMSVQHVERNADIKAWREQAYAKRFKREPVWEGGSSISLPITHWVINLITDRLVLSQFALHPLMHIRPVSLQDFELANSLERVLNHYYQRTNKREVVAQAVNDAVLLGAGVVRVVWKSRKVKWGRERVVQYPCTEYVPLENFYLLTPTLPMEEQGAVAHKYWRRRGELNQYDPELVDKISASQQDDQFFIRHDTRTAYAHKPNDLIELVDIFYKEDGKWRMAVYSPQGIVLKDEEFRYPTSVLPYFLLRFTVGDGYGYGLAPLLEPLEEELSVLHNQRIDNNTLINLPVFKVLSSSPASRDNDTWFAGKKLIVDTPDDVTVLAQPERITPLQDEQQLFDYIKLLSGVSEILGGAPMRGERTAFEIETMMTEGSVRFRRYLLAVGDWLTDQAKYELLLLKHYGRDVSKVVSATGVAVNPFDMIDDEDILYRFDYQYNTVLTNREVERQKWVLLRNLLATDPLMASNQRGWYEMLRQMLQAFDVDWRVLIGEAPPQSPPMLPTSVPPVDISQLPPEVLGAVASVIGSLGGTPR